MIQDIKRNRDLQKKSRRKVSRKVSRKNVRRVYNKNIRKSVSRRNLRRIRKSNLYGGTTTFNLASLKKGPPAAWLGGFPVKPAPAPAAQQIIHTIDSYILEFYKMPPIISCEILGAIGDYFYNVYMKNIRDPISLKRIAIKYSTINTGYMHIIYNFVKTLKNLTEEIKVAITNTWNDVRSDDVLNITQDFIKKYTLHILKNMSNRDINIEKLFKPKLKPACPIIIDPEDDSDNERFAGFEGYEDESDFEAWSALPTSNGVKNRGSYLNTPIDSVQAMDNSDSETYYGFGHNYEL